MIEHKGNLPVVSHRGISHRYTSHPVIGRTENTNQNKYGDFKTHPNGTAICVNLWPLKNRQNKDLNDKW